MISTFILAGLVGIVYPLFFMLTYKKVNDKIKANDQFRLKDYKQTIVIFWVLTSLILANSILETSLKLNFYPTFSITGIILFIVVCAFILFQSRNTSVTAETFPLIKEKMGNVYPYLPKTQTELTWFTLLSISAGICEEIIFRLFLFTFLLEHAHISIAFVLTNIIFALSHIGSGKQNLLSSFILGLLFTAIYYFTDNIWIAIILHAGIDINTGLLGYRTHQFEIKNRNLA